MCSGLERIRIELSSTNHAARIDVAKKLSATELSQQSPLRLMLLVASRLVSASAWLAYEASVPASSMGVVSTPTSKTGAGGAQLSVSNEATIAIALVAT